MPLQFSPKACPSYTPAGWVDKYKLVAYQTAGVNFPVESNQRFDTKAEAQAACDRANSGNESGLTFASFSDD